MKFNLSDICEFVKGKTEVSALDGSTYISTENMLPNRGGVCKATNLPAIEQTQSYCRDDTLVSNIRPYFKKIWQACKDGGCSSDVLVFRAKKGISPDFLYYVLSDDMFFEYAMATSKGTKMPRGDKTAIMQYYVPDFDYITQCKIASILKCLDHRIEQNSAINENLEQQAQALFVSWFVNYEPFDGVEPKDWESMSVYDLAEYINGAAFKKGEYADRGVPIIKIAELKNGITDSTQHCCVTKDVKYYIDDRDILFSWSGNPDTSIDTFIWSMGKAILNQHTFRVVSKYNAPGFTFFLLKHLMPQFTHIASNKQTTGLGHVTVADLKRLRFGTSENAIRAFNDLVMPFFDIIFLNYKEMQYFSSLLDTLVPKLMSGEIDVSNVTI